MSEPRPGLQPIVDSAASQDKASAPAIASESRTGERALEAVVEYVLADCFCAVGQTIGMRITVDYDAVVWWHDHFHAKFLAAMRRHGNRWLQDRETVTGVGWMLAERAVRHAAGQNSIDVGTARRAAADVERYCEIRAKRAQAGGRDSAGSPRLAGYWCIRPPW